MTIARRAALLAAVTALVAVPLGIAPDTARAQPAHVAIVVAGDHSACVPWHPGMTGADVLEASGANYDVRWGRQSPYLGFVLQIDGRGTLHPDDEDYWSYWQDTGSGWSYSGRGATSTAVRPGTVEGWSYVDGQSSATAPPAASYASICAGQDTSPSPTRHPSTTPRSHPPSTSTTHSRPSSRAPRTATSAQHTSPGAPARPTTATITPTPTKSATAHRPSTSQLAAPGASAPAATPTGGPATTVGRSVTTSAATIAAASASPSATPRAASDRTAALPSWTTALALLVVAGIGAAAVVRIRGSRR